MHNWDESSIIIRLMFCITVLCHRKITIDDEGRHMHDCVGLLDGIGKMLVTNCAKSNRAKTIDVREKSGIYDRRYVFGSLG
jgi:hypothetical protein